MSELETKYAGQADFVIVSAVETAKRSAEIEEYGFTALKHGLVVFGPNGEPVAKLPGHAFGRDEIEAALQTALDLGATGG